MISQGMERGDYSNLWAYGENPMSKGTHKVVNYPFFSFCAQSSKSGWRSYLLGMGKTWRSNSNLGGHPFLESVFLTCGTSKILGRNSQAIMHPWISFLTNPGGFLAPSCNRKKLSSLLHGLVGISFPSPYSNYVLGVVGASGKEGAMILGFEEAVFSPVRKLGVLLHIFLHFSYFLQAGKLIFGFPASGRRTHEFWVLLSLFWPR